MEAALLLIVPLLIGYALDLILGDPENWPHPVRLFGNAIAFGEKRLNVGSYRMLAGAGLSLTLVGVTFLMFSILGKLFSLNVWLWMGGNGIFVWYGLANTTLIKEGRAVFDKLQNEGLDAGRVQLSRIVGRDTSQLSTQQVRIAVLETMSENLSDGVIAPLFYYMIAGVPGMMAYKMINTLDSMIGYRSERYELFGKFAARLDDVANFVPARLTAMIMVLVAGSRRGFTFVKRFGNKHKSPNAGYPEAALAGILDVRFGGPNVYHGVLVNKPFIGETDRVVGHEEIMKVLYINQLTCAVMVLMCCFVFILFKN